MKSFTTLLIVLGATIGATIILVIGLRLAGLLTPYRVPTAAMQPTIRNDDCVLMEGMSYLLHAPQRGDLLVFSTKGLISTPPDQVFVKRVVGLPGEKLQIENGALLVNGAVVAMKASTGEPIRYFNLNRFPDRKAAPFVVPANSYFVLGDNSATSLDSRFFGSVPQPNIRGRVWFRYWPWR